MREAPPDIVARLVIVEVEGVEPAPVRAAEDVLAPLVAPEQVGALAKEFALALGDEGREPDPGADAAVVGALDEARKPVRKFDGVDVEPVADEGLVAVVDLEEVETLVEVLENIRKDMGDFVIVPSSVHEVLIMPLKQVDDLKGLTMIIREVNRTVISKTEWLSDDAYIFDGELHKA